MTRENFQVLLHMCQSKNTSVFLYKFGNVTSRLCNKHTSQEKISKQVTTSIKFRNDETYVSKQFM